MLDESKIKKQELYKTYTIPFRSDRISEIIAYTKGVMNKKDKLEFNYLNCIKFLIGESYTQEAIEMDKKEVCIRKTLLEFLLDQDNRRKYDLSGIDIHRYIELPSLEDIQSANLQIDDINMETGDRIICFANLILRQEL